METSLDIAPLMRWKTARFFAKFWALLSPLADAAQGSGTRLSYALPLNPKIRTKQKATAGVLHAPPGSPGGRGCVRCEVCYAESSGEPGTYGAAIGSKLRATACLNAFRRGRFCVWSRFLRFCLALLAAVISFRGPEPCTPGR